VDVTDFRGLDVSDTCPDTLATFATSGSYWGCSPYPAPGLGLVTGCTSGTLLLSGSDQYTWSVSIETVNYLKLDSCLTAILQRCRVRMQHGILVQ
jgi:hypothetical protein